LLIRTRSRFVGKITKATQNACTVQIVNYKLSDLLARQHLSAKISPRASRSTIAFSTLARSFCKSDFPTNNKHRFRVARVTAIRAKSIATPRAFTRRSQATEDKSVLKSSVFRTLNATVGGEQCPKIAPHSPYLVFMSRIESDVYTRSVAVALSTESV